MNKLFALIVLAALPAFAQRYVGIYGNETNGAVLPLAVEARIAAGESAASVAEEAADLAESATVAAAQVSAVQSNLTAHATDTNNPHQVTPAQIGAATGTPLYVEADAAGIAWAETNAASIAAVGAVASNALPVGTTNSLTLAYSAARGGFAGTETISPAKLQIENYVEISKVSGGTSAGYGKIKLGGNTNNGEIVFHDAANDGSDYADFSLTVNDYAAFFTPTNKLAIALLWSWADGGFSGTNTWEGRLNDVESARIAALAENSGISASDATNIAQAVVAEATTNDMPGIDWSSLGGGGSSPAPSKSLGASAVGWPILNTNNAHFVSILVDADMGPLLNFPLDAANSVDAMPIVSGTSASITQLVFVARAYAADGSEWGTVGLRTAFGGSILTNVVTLTNAPTTQTVTLAHAPVSGPCVVPFSWGILPTSTVGTAVGNARFSVMQARGSW